MKKILKWLGIGFVGFLVLGMFAEDDTTTKTTGNANNNQTAIEEPAVNNEELICTWKDPIEWKGRTLQSDIYYAYNDDYAIVIDEINKIEDCIQLKYTFYNESNETMSSLWVITATPYQNGVNLNDSEDFGDHYYECFNEQTSIMPGYSINDCSELIPIGDGSDITILLGCGMWNDTHVMTINPNTLDYSIEDK